MDIRKQALIAGGITAVIIRLSIDIVKVAIWGLIGWFGWNMFHHSTAWYWSVIGFMILINGVGVILPAIDLIWTCAISFAMPFAYVIAITKDYWAYREHSKDVKELMSIARDFLPRDTYDKYSMREKNKTVNDMYNHYFVILLWSWIYHLEATSKNSASFLELVKERYPEAASVYEYLTEDMNFEMMKLDLIDLQYMYAANRNEDFCRRLSYAVNWCARRLTTSDENAKNLSYVFGNLATDFIKANKL